MTASRLTGNGLLGQVEAIEHLALLVDRCLCGVEVLGRHPVVVEDSPCPNPTVEPVMSRIGHSRRPRNLS
jgi:hypothetical protein